MARLEACPNRDCRPGGVAHQLADRGLKNRGWQQVQDLLAANNDAAVFQRRNLHYLRGSLSCGDCGSRLMVIYAKYRWGTTYTYLTCSGRKRKTTRCQRQAMHAEVVEELSKRSTGPSRSPPSCVTASRT